MTGDGAGAGEEPRSRDEDGITYVAGEGGDEMTSLDPQEMAEWDAIRDLLSDPSVWAQPDPSLEDRVVAAVTAEAATSETDRSAVSAATHGDRRRAVYTTHARPRRRRLLVLGGAVAAAIVVVVLAVGGNRGGGTARMTATLAAPPGGGASGTATLTRTSAGWRIELRTEGLPRLDGGRFYEAWMKNSAGTLVAIGTFNQGPTVTLWSGVSPTEFSTITVTAQDVNSGPASSGQRVLAGTIIP